MSSFKRGALIVFEGCDRVGKTTQVSLLLKALQDAGRQVRLQKFPDRDTGTGRMINDYLSSKQSSEKTEAKPQLSDEAIHLLFSINRWQAVKQMLDDLKQGTTVLVDRYAYSGVAYSAAKPNLSLEWCRLSDVGLPQPDNVIYLISDKALNRDGYGDERYEKAEFQAIVRKNYDLLKDSYWKVINTDSSIEDTHKIILEYVNQAIDSDRDETIGQLWT